MPSFNKWFDHSKHSTEAKKQFESWPVAPPAKQIPIPFVEFSSQPVRIIKQQDTEIEYNPAIVIGLGRTGELIVHQWLDQVKRDSIASTEKLRILIISEELEPKTHRDGNNFRRFSISKENQSQSAETYTPTNLRSEIHTRFRQMIICNPILQHIQNCIMDLRDDIRVILVASVAEASIGAMGDILQILQIAKNESRNSYLSISALLTLSSTDACLPIGEIYAVLREIGRFTIGGIQWMEKLVGASDAALRGPLLNHIFLIETTGRIDTLNDPSVISFDRGCGQAMADALFILLHPSSIAIWGDLAKQVMNVAREETHEVYVNTLGIATLRVPFNEIADYAASRLAKAAIFGERPDQRGEGLISVSQFPIDEQLEGRVIASRWLRAPFASHPVFEWLLEANSPEYFRFIPMLNEEFDVAYQTQICHGLVRLLNDREERDQLAQSQAALEWLVEHLNIVQGWVSKSPITEANSSNRMAFQALLNRWLVITLSLKQKVEVWKNALSSIFSSGENDKTWRGGAMGENPERGSWRQPVERPTQRSDWRALTNERQGVVYPIRINGPSSLYELLDKNLDNAELAFTEAIEGQFRVAITADKTGTPLQEVEAYYKDTIRPELSWHNRENSRAFRYIRERLGWWIREVPGVVPEILLICMPVLRSEQSGSIVFGQLVHFRPEQLDEFAQELHEIALTQVKGIKIDLNSPWIQDRLNHNQEFLKRAASPLLSYDLETASIRPGQNALLMYMIGRDKEITGRYQNVAFPNASTKQIKEVETGEITRLSALGLWINIPINAVHFVRKAYRDYYHQHAFHLYPQEKHAALYERRIHRVTQRWEELPPELTLALVDLHLVTLFCQLVICGLIDIEKGEYQQSPKWIVHPIDSFAKLELDSDDDLYGLWRALRRFSLELPNDPNQELNPTNQFHLNNRKAYIQALQAKVRQIRQKTDFPRQIEKFRQGVLTEWGKMSNSDILARGILNILAVELEDPFWESWW